MCRVCLGWKGQPPAPGEQQAQHHAYSLGQNGGQRSPGHTHAARAHQEQIADDVHRAGDGHGAQRRFGIPDPPKHGSQNIVGDNEHRAAGADPDIGYRLPESLGGRLHQPRHGRRRPQHSRCERQRHRGEQRNGAAEHLSALVRLALAKPLPQQYGGAHGQAGNQRGDRVHHLTAGGHGGHIRRLAEPPHDHQVHRAVHRLQQKRRQHGEGEAQQRRQNRSLDKTSGLFHKDTPCYGSGARKKPGQATGVSARHLIRPRASRGRIASDD